MAWGGRLEGEGRCLKLGGGGHGELGGANPGAPALNRSRGTLCTRKRVRCAPMWGSGFFRGRSGHQTRKCGHSPTKLNNATIFQNKFLN